MIRKAPFFLALFLLAFAPLSLQAAEPVKELIIKDLTVGEGTEARLLDQVKVHYTGWLMDGTKFDSSLDRGRPFPFTLGAGNVIRGWDMGVMGMKVGGKRELVIPYTLAYGVRGFGDVIPGRSDLRFEVELLDVAPVEFNDIGFDEMKTLQAEGAKLVDLRRPLEWSQTGVVKGSKLITSHRSDGRLMDGFEDKLTTFAEPDDKLILICRSGNRSRQIAMWLAKKKGYTQVYNVVGGVKAWKSAGNATVEPTLD